MGDRVRLEVVTEFTTRCASGRVTLVWCANQHAVLVAPTSSPTCEVVGVGGDAGLQLADLGLQRVSSTNVERVSTASIDHTDASTTESATSRICAVADATRWRGVVIAVMVQPKH